MFLAAYGRELSELERLLHSFYQAWPWNERIQRGEALDVEHTLREYGRLSDAQIQEYRSALAKAFRDNVETLTDIFLNAVIEKDSHVIREIASAIESLKNGFPKKDALREFILSSNLSFMANNHRLTIREWAKLIDWPERDPDDCENGYPHLKRLLKELHIPVRR